MTAADPLRMLLLEKGSGAEAACHGAVNSPRLGRMDVTGDQEHAAARSGAASGAAVSTLVVRPFIHHGRFKRFLTALEQRPGVLGVQPGRVHGGAVWLTVHHMDTVSIAPLMESLAEFSPRIEPGTGGTWLVQLADECEDDEP